jgi:hypothetical protein
MLIGFGGLLISEIVVLLPAWTYDCEGTPRKCYTCDPDRPNSRDRDDPPAEDDRPSKEEVAAQRLNSRSSRFNAVLCDLRNHDVPNISDLFSAPLHGSLQELSERVDHLYVEAASFSRKRNWQFEENGAFGDAVHHADGFPAYAMQPPYKAPAVAPADVNRIAATGEIKDFIGMTPRAQPINGSIEDKLNAFKDVKDVLDYVISRIAF